MRLASAIRIVCYCFPYPGKAITGLVPLASLSLSLENKPVAGEGAEGPIDDCVCRKG